MLVINPPDEYEQMLGPLPRNVHFKKRLAPNLDWIHYFALSRFGLLADMVDLRRSISRRGTLWISWQSAGLQGKERLSADVVRELVVKHDLIPGDVCVLDSVWSAMNFHCPPESTGNPYI